MRNSIFFWNNTEFYHYKKEFIEKPTLLNKRVETEVNSSKTLERYYKILLAIRGHLLLKRQSFEEEQKVGEKVRVFRVRLCVHILFSVPVY